MANTPVYLTNQTEDTIRQRMLKAISDTNDKTEGGFIWDSIAPLAIELVLAIMMAKEVHRKGFAQTAASTVAGEVTEELTNRAAEHGVIRKQAEYATATVTFIGALGSSIPAGSRVSTVSTSSVAAVVFITTTDAAIGAGGTANVRVKAVTAGTGGNVGAGTITVKVDNLAGITSLVNETAASGGVDLEDDVTLLPRYLLKVQNPSAGGNKADYQNWALECNGVGKVSVIPIRDGPGTVSIALLDTNLLPAGQTIVDAVQEYIAPLWVHIKEAEAMTVSGYGVSIDAAQDGNSGACIKMVYNAGGFGQIAQNLNGILERPGIWKVTPRIKASTVSESSDLLQIGVYNTTTGAWCKTTSGESAEAVETLKGTDLDETFTDEIPVWFYWNGKDAIELRIIRQVTDTATDVWVDLITIKSTFSTDTGDALAPVGAAVTVEAATAIPITIAATLTIQPGYSAAAVKAAAEASVANYIRDRAFADDNDVRWGRIGQAVLATTGVADYANLTVNGGTGNITIGDQEVATLGTVTFT